jgi:hypothetical protein
MELGEILVRLGLLSRAQLESALADERAQEGRLGTYLVEKNILTSDQLALGLAEQFRVPPALEADFARSDAALRRRLVVHQAIELQAIPLFFTGPRRVAVAMANPASPRAVDRLAFVFGATVDPMVTSEVALLRQFQLLYGVRRKHAADAVRRTASNLPLPQELATRSPATESSEIRPALRSHRRRDNETTKVPPAKLAPLETPKVPPAKLAPLETPKVPPPKLAPLDTTKVPQLQLAPLEPCQEGREPGAPIQVMEDALCFTPTPQAFLPPAPVSEPPLPSRMLSHHPLTPLVVPISNAGLQLAVEQIRFATDQQDLSDSLFSFMRACFGVGALFAVSGAFAQGRFGFSGGRVRPDVANLRLSLSLPSCLRIARSRRAAYRGLPPPDGSAVHGSLWEALETETPSDVLVSPVIVDGLVTLLLYAQGELGRRINSVAVSKTEQVCDALSSSLLRLAG